MTQGMGASLLRPPHVASTKPGRDAATSPTELSRPSALLVISQQQRAPATTAEARMEADDDDDLDGLASRMAASLAFTPRSVQRKGKMVVK
jgi:hypothetical protein